MGHRKSVAELTEMLARARAREAARTAARSTNTTYVTRGPQTEALYRSMFRTSTVNGTTNRAVYKISVDAGTVGNGAAGVAAGVLKLSEVGLLDDNATLPAGEVLVGHIKGTGCKPTRLSWYMGQTPVAVPANAQHGRYIKRWKQDGRAGGGQSHRSTPFSVATGTIDSAKLQAAFNTVLTISTFKNALGDGGVATLHFEEGYLTGK